jgi:hypothetical protein
MKFQDLPTRDGTKARRKEWRGSDYVWFDWTDGFWRDTTEYELQYTPDADDLAADDWRVIE